MKNTTVMATSSQETCEDKHGDSACFSKSNEEVKHESSFHAPSKYELVNKVIVDSSVYVTHLAACPLATDRLAVASTDCTVRLFDTATCKVVHSIKGHTDQISDIHFGNSDSLLWTCSTDGSIKSWDTRKNETQPVHHFQDTSKGSPKPLLSFDLNTTESIICAGTENILTDAFILFWDIKASKLLGGYWESHTDDIVQVHFHPVEHNVLLTASIDGLINIFDVMEKQEDEALQITLNTSSSVSKVKWSSDTLLPCLTQTSDLQLWNTTEGTLVKKYDRERIQDTYSVNYLVDIYQSDFKEENEVLFLAGSKRGNGKLLKYENNELHLQGTFFSGHSDLIRASIRLDDKFVTAGEDGAVCIWKMKSNENDCTNLKVNVSKKLGDHHKKPY